MQPLLSASGWHGLTVMEERNDSTDFAVVIFLAMFILIITEVWERHIVTLGCALLTLILVFGICMHSPSAIIETLNIHSIFHRDSGTQQVKQAKLLLESTGKLSCSSLV